MESNIPYGIDLIRMDANQISEAMKLQNEKYIETMRTAKDVKDWNKKREDIIEDFAIGCDGCNSEQYEIYEKNFNDILNIIDGSRLIVKVLGQDASGIIHRMNNPSLYIDKN